MIKRFQSLSLLVFLLAPTTVFAIDWKDCRIGPKNSPRTVKASCSTLLVPENRAEKDGKLISLRVAKVWSWNKKSKPDPVLYLAGGPGQSAIDSYVQIEPGFQQLIKERDILLVDQRGTGKSNPLNCKIDKAYLFSTPTEEESKEFLSKCLSTLNADTRYYTTTESIKDLEDVRKALNLDQWNLIGVSYGTRKALTYSKLFPQAIRSMTLDGVAPQQEALGARHEENLRLALERQFSECKAQKPCNKAFGNPQLSLEEIMNQADKKPLSVNVADPVTGKRIDILLTREVLATVVRMYSYTAENFRLLPLLLDLARNGQIENLAAQSMIISKSLDDAISLGMDMSVTCAEDAPFYPINSEEHAFLSKEKMLTIRKRQCDLWPHIPVSPEFKKPVVSDIPTLLLSGELDPVTPPSFADAAAATLSNSRHLVAKGTGHGVFMRGCIPFVVRDFIDSPTGELNIECMDNFSAPAFFVNLMGPEQ